MKKSVVMLSNVLASWLLLNNLRVPTTFGKLLPVASVANLMFAIYIELMQVLQAKSSYINTPSQVAP